MYSLKGRELAKAAGVGVATAVILSAIMITALKTGISPMPKPLAVAFASTLLGKDVPIPVGLAFHVAWVTLWSVVYVKLFWERLSFGRALGLALALLVLVLVAFYPFVGWGLLGLAVSPKLIPAAVVSHFLFALVLWALSHWVFGAEHGGQADRMSRA